MMYDVYLKKKKNEKIHYGCMMYDVYLKKKNEQIHYGRMMYDVYLEIQ